MFVFELIGPARQSFGFLLYSSLTPVLSSLGLRCLPSVRSVKVENFNLYAAKINKLSSCMFKALTQTSPVLTKDVCLVSCLTVERLFKASYQYLLCFRHRSGCVAGNTIFQINQLTDGKQEHYSLPNVSSFLPFLFLCYCELQIVNICLCTDRTFSA